MKTLLEFIKNDNIINNSTGVSNTNIEINIRKELNRLKKAGILKTFKSKIVDIPMMQIAGYNTNYGALSLFPRQIRHDRNHIKYMGDDNFISYTEEYLNNIFRFTNIIYITLYLADDKYTSLFDDIIKLSNGVNPSKCKSRHFDIKFTNKEDIITFINLLPEVKI